jgi:hypothetical protein
MTTIYLVTNGSYSDYCVLGVYSTKEKAEHAKRLFAADNGIDEYGLDAIPDSPPGMLAYQVSMLVSGDVKYVWQDTVEGFESRWYVAPQWGADVIVVFHVWARDIEHAVKIANEWRAQIVALGLWDLHKILRVANSRGDTELCQVFKESCQTQPEA